MRDEATQTQTDPLIRRLIVSAFAVVFCMAGFSIFILGQDSVQTGLLLTLASLLSGLGGWSIGKKT